MNAYSHLQYLFKVYTPNFDELTLNSLNSIYSKERRNLNGSLSPNFGRFVLKECVFQDLEKKNQVERVCNQFCLSGQD